MSSWPVSFGITVVLFVWAFTIAWSHRVAREHAEHVIRREIHIPRHIRMRMIAAIRHCPVGQVEQELRNDS